tara:strand:+ start:7933 stop:8352 length:420 start_codon:yes stop_codon:yes gene_type:complete
MPLSTTEQLQIMRGEVSPPNETFKNIVIQNAFKFSNNFYDTYKEFPITDVNGSINLLANSYREKIFRIAQRVYSMENKATLDVLSRIVTVIIGATVSNLGTLQNATTEQWETFIYNQMDEAFEYLSGVKKDEKLEYTNL